MTLQASFKDLATAGKAYGAEHGYYGKIGGWIYREGRSCGNKNPGTFDLCVCQGWYAFGERLKARGTIKLAKDGRYTIQ